MTGSLNRSRGAPIVNSGSSRSLRSMSGKAAVLSPFRKRRSKAKKTSSPVRPSSIAACSRLNAVTPSGELRPLAVDICALHVEDTKRGDGCLIAVAPVEPGAGQQLDVAAIDAGVHAIAIVLDLVDPAGTVRRFVHESRQLRLDPSWGMAVGRITRFLRMARHSALLGPRRRIRPIERLKAVGHVEQLSRRDRHGFSDRGTTLAELMKTPSGKLTVA